ncbi:ATP-binding protein [Haliovirga abyssi]|uniref:histidine kinase n=1 Tax=Haliovirga abyssi TaxID=2996794 RepID=A0AAU9DWH3_9FUSO|nr:ATP-binding protein [Haliovirga abyssi]BDU49595.1 hypothetical protein HLVA_01640 [Haliovirga abyssi]
MAKNKIKNNLIFGFISFSIIVILIVVGFFYINIRSSVIDFNKDIVSNNEQTILTMINSNQTQGKKVILQANSKVMKNTKERLNSFIKKASKENNESLLKIFSKTIDQEIKMKEFELKNIVKSQMFVWEDIKSERDSLKKLLKKNSDYKGFIVYGELIDPFFQVGKITENFYKSKIVEKTRRGKTYFYNINNTNYFYLAVPIYNSKQKYNGFIIAKIDIKPILSKLFKEITLGSDRTIFVINSNKKIIKHINKKYENKKFTRVNFNKRLDFQQIIKNKIIYTIKKYNYGNFTIFIVIKEYISDAFSYVDSLKDDTEKVLIQSFNDFNKDLKKASKKTYDVSKEKALDKLNSFIKNIANIFYVVFFIGVLVSILLGIFFADGITKPIKELSFAAKKIGDGNLEYNFDKKLLKRKDEIGELSREFSEMKIRLKENIETVKELERKKAHSERLSIMGQIVSGIVHEIKNPLTSISGFAQIIEETSGEETIRRQSKMIFEEAQRLNKLTLDLLEYAKGSKLDMRRVKVKLLAEEVFDKLSPKITEKNIKVSVDVPENFPTIYADRDKIMQVFINLISNAVEAIKMRRGNIEFIADRIGTGKVEIKIRNDGPVIPEDIIKDLFLPFISHKKGGTGLGLAMVKKIIEDHKGNIKITKGLEKGAEFVIVLPIK